MGAQRHFNPISKLAALRVEPIRQRLQTWIARFLCPEVLFPTSMLVAFEAGSLVRAILLLASVPLVEFGGPLPRPFREWSTHYPASAGLNWPCSLTGVQGWIFCVHPEDLGARPASSRGSPCIYEFRLYMSSNGTKYELFASSIDGDAMIL
ncbi:hypothetical protein PVL29_010410 [Vitis rotundifolia]|uniref:Glycerol-3-phosphate acyltransferase RAM2/GPAT1-8 HAD-like domain-containing protein n=1 Tax=Vitis rotundifolia TaxID=103349 RepID=A0AA38ZTH8_VITRO|nr:hypothetical protein PVL29_010410 [Vitis rotundifolia]